MNDQTESLDSILCEFNDDQCPPDLTVRPIPAPILRPFFRRQLFPEQAFSWRQDLAELSELIRAEEQACLGGKDLAGAAYCAGNLAIIAKAAGDTRTAQFAQEAQGLAVTAGLAEIVTRMQALRRANGS